MHPESAPQTANGLPRPTLSLNMPRFEGLEETFDSGADLVCFSHLRWDFVYQRPQHLMSRCARERRVFFVEEPVFIDESPARLNSRIDRSGVCVVVPHLPASIQSDDVASALKHLIDEMWVRCGYSRRSVVVLHADGPILY